MKKYFLILQRLLEHTDQAHEDYLLLRKAEKEIHELAIRMSTIEKESNEQEVKSNVNNPQMSQKLQSLNPSSDSAAAVKAA